MTSDRNEETSISVFTGELRSQVAEDVYRLSKKSIDDRFAIRSILITSVIFALFFIADLQTIQETQLLILFAGLRLGPLVFGVSVAVFIRKGCNPFQRDVLVLVFAILLFSCAAIGAAKLGRSSVELAPTALVMILGMFVFLPNRFWFLLAGALYGATALFLAPLASGGASARNTFILSGLAVVSIIIGCLATVRFNRLRRLEYLDALELERANEKLQNEIAERRSVEQELVKAKSLAEEASQSKSYFLAAASHDLRQPLQAIALFSASLDSLFSNSKNLDRDQVLKMVRSLSLSVSSLSRQLNTLLDLSKLESGSYQPEYAPYRIQEMFNELYKTFGPVAHNKGIALRLVACDETVFTDQALLRQIVSNLTSNSIRYTASGRVLIGCRRLPGGVRIEVWDTGEGIAEKDRAVIFEEFRQLGNTARNSEKGVGLGLAIVKRSADLLGHKIDMRSEVGKGTVFAITIPKLHQEMGETIETNLNRSVCLDKLNGMILEAENG